MPLDQEGEGSFGEVLRASQRRPGAKGNGGATVRRLSAMDHGKESLASGLIWAENRPVRLGRFFHFYIKKTKF